ncbi:MAG: right-handed parallel beta-helix repeat-containing protein, partial [Thermoplasmata archaeon]|nr:right-handed parallel beta-helix repeat-containing protein [Thermoplasmata archaeon]
MNSGKVRTVAIFLLLISGFFICVSIEPPIISASGSIIYVGGSGSGNYTNIQEAIDNANKDDTIFIYKGEYFENLIINKKIKLIGEDKDLVTIKGTGSNNVILITSYEVHIENLTLTNSGDLWGDGGIEIQDAQRCKIINNNLLHNSNGIYISESSKNNIISQNIIFENSNEGIYIHNSNDNEIINNKISFNSQNGVCIWISSNNFIKGNNISYNSEDGIHLSENSQTEVYNNIINFNDGCGIYVYYSPFTKIVDNNILNNYCGIRIIGSDMSNITNCNLFYNTMGITSDYSDNLDIINNYLNSGEIFFTDSSYVNIVNNTFIDKGILIYGEELSHFNSHYITTNNLIDGKSIYYYKDTDSIDIDGIQAGQIILANCDYCKVINLDISNVKVGIEIAFSNNNQIFNNNLSLNTIGIYLYSSSNNLIFHNNFIDNYQHFTDNTRNNIFNEKYPSGGNYWSDISPHLDDLYNGPQTPQIAGFSDGICDNSYSYKGNIDYFPLKNPWNPNYKCPSNISNCVANADDSFINISWNPPVDTELPVAMYKIYKNQSADNDIFIIDCYHSSHFNDTNVTNGIIYYYKISAVNIMGEGPLSEEIKGIPSTTPSAPLNLKTEMGDFYINLTWDLPFNDGGLPITNYKIYKGNVSGKIEFLNFIENVLYYNDTEVSNDVTYLYRISGINSRGEGTLSNETNITYFSKNLNQHPICKIIIPSDGTEISGIVKIYGNASDPDGIVQHLELKIDNGSWFIINTSDSWTFFWDTKNITNGPYIIYARAFDGIHYSLNDTSYVIVNNPIQKESSQDSDRKDIFSIFLMIIIILVI